jgi:hypothetical protein
MSAPAPDGRPSKLQRIKLNAMLVGSSCRALGRRQRASPAVGYACPPARLPGWLAPEYAHSGPPPRDLF